MITGATSFIGSALTRRLLEEGNRVYAVCRPDSPNISALPEGRGLTIIYADADNIQMIEEHVNHADIFINLAWKGTTHEQRDNEEINSKNVQNTLYAMKCASDLGCSLFVESGSQAEYGYQTSLTDESAVCQPFTAYGRAKLATMTECSRYAKRLEIRYLHLRIFSIYGPGDHPYTLISQCVDKMIRNEAIDLTEGSQTWNFLYIDDAVSIITALIDKCSRQLVPGETQVVNVASDDTRVLSHFIQEMKTVIGSESMLRFGAVKAQRLLSIIPDTSKLHTLIDPVKLHPFREGIKSYLK